ncbi:MAG: phosphatidylglycerophosphatase A [Phycisphaerae bacterium]
MNGDRTVGERLLLLAGSIGPLGHLPASGTVTVVLVGVPLYYVMHTWHWLMYVLVTAAFATTSVWLHHVGDEILGSKDSGRLVWDEIVGFMVAVACVPFTWQLVLFALVAERAIDIVKFPPAGYIERHWPGGWGVVGDDVVAGLYTRGLMHLAIWYKPVVMGVTS